MLFLQNYSAAKANTVVLKELGGIVPWIVWPMVMMNLQASIQMAIHDHKLCGLTPLSPSVAWLEVLESVLKAIPESENKKVGKFLAFLGAEESFQELAALSTDEIIATLAQLTDLEFPSKTSYVAVPSAKRKRTAEKVKHTFGLLSPKQLSKHKVSF